MIACLRREDRESSSLKESLHDRHILLRRAADVGQADRCAQISWLWPLLEAVLGSRNHHLAAYLHSHIQFTPLPHSQRTIGIIVHDILMS